MSKSKGNVVTPVDILAQHGSDAVRYWAASSRLGTDAAFDPLNPTQIKIGRRLAIKVLNAAKFVLSFPVPEGAEITHALDASMLTTLDGVVREATKALEAYDHARALEVAESFFWTFCDDYLELVKERAYDRTDVGQASAALALRIALSTLLRLFAPVISFATEESWSWFNDGSVHTAPWPEPLGIEGDPAILVTASEALIGIRRAKTEAKASQKTAVTRMTIAAPAEAIAALKLAEGDLRAVGRIAEITYTDAVSTTVVDIELAPQEA
jgi:valyl-tRNA synthetase